MDLKQLEALIKLCRKLGVSNISVDGISLSLTADSPVSNYKRRIKKIPQSPFEKALSEAKDVATRAKIKYAAEQAGQPINVTADPDKDIEGPTELDMLFWSAGSGDNAS